MNRTPSREEELFADALAQPEAIRAVFLETACGGDRALRSQVEALLAAHGASENLLEPIVIREDAFGAEESPGDWIGRYKLLKELGEGGCGIVWMAEQEEPVQRQVALKVIKPGMDTREVIARFAIERQALAIMDHAGIAKVLDAGETDAGRPFFVMELVRGVRITQYCDEHALSVAARLELFLQVCHAVQHAHQKGVIHRDLKPSNILVTLPEGGTGGVVKVIDFGIAKATQGRLVDGTLVTAFEQFIGTPVYMSPEQADTNGLDIDTRSDVYSLGVLLYELLAGRPPFDPKTLSQLDRDEIRRMIRDVDPPRPSARFATIDANERESIARLRATEPATLAELLTGDLDWIAMKALEKDRARRYETAAGFAADVTRYLHHEPVVARPPSKIYRLGKMVRRNRLAVAAAATVALTLFGAAVVSVGHAVRAKRAEDRANVERAHALDERARVEELLDFMIGDLRGPLRQVGQLAVLESVARKSLDYFAGRTLRELNDADLTRHAKALIQLGDLRIEQARHAEAQRAFKAAHERAEMITTRAPDDPEAQLLRAHAEGWMGLVLRRRNDLDAAHVWFTRQKATTEALLARSPTNARWRLEVSKAQHSLADLAVARGQLEAARESYLNELQTLNALAAAAPRDGSVTAQKADVISWLGTIAERTGNLQQAARHYAEQVAQVTEASRAEPQDSHWQLKLAESTGFLGSVLAMLGEKERALKILRDARAAVEIVAPSDKANTRWENGLLTLFLREAMVARSLGQTADASRLIDRARTGYERLAAIEGMGLRFTGRLATAWRLTAEVRHAEGDPAAAPAAARALELGASLTGGGPNMTPERGELANACVIAGRIAAAQGDMAAARTHWKRGYDLLAAHLATTRDWRALDPAVRLTAFLGRVEDTRAFRERLQEIGYVPLQPWPQG